MPTPWDNLGDAYPKGRRLEEFNQNFFVSKDIAGNFLLMAIFEGGVNEEELPQLKGIDANIIPYGQQKTALILKLESKENADKFEIVCRDLALHTARLTGEVLISATLKRLGSWSRFVGPRRDGIGEARLLGLWGELHTLCYSILPECRADLAIRSWLGPEGGKQDFVLERNAVEVKTRKAGFTPDIQINSAEQLHKQTDRLFLHVLSLSPSEEGRCLNDIKQNIVDAVSSSADAETRFIRLFNERTEHATDKELATKFEVSDVETFEVLEGFPLLGPLDLAKGIVSINYKISLVQIARFLVEDVSLSEALKVG